MPNRGQSIGKRRQPAATFRSASARCLTWGAIVILFATFVGASSSVARAQADAPEPPGDASQQLIERFAPIIMVKQQSSDCDAEGEPYRPADVDILFDNPEIALRQVGRSDPIVTWAPNAEDLSGLGEGFFLDFPGSSLAPECIFETDFDKYAADTPATIYAHIVQPQDARDKLVVQYWFYWYYNDWNNKHESDWEGISLLFEASSIEEALASVPTEVGYSQHEGGESADWDAGKLERVGDRPVVYASAGSHASYFGSSIYLGRSGAEGFGCDDTTGPSDLVAATVILLPDSVDDPADSLAWVSYNGRWGERQSGSFNGPTGPAVKERWLDPMPWFDELRTSSVVIPAGDSDGVGVISAFCGVVERGSQALTSFNISPTRVVVALFVLALFARFLVRRTDWSRVPAEPLRQRRRAGQIMRAATTTYRGAPASFMASGLLYLPAAALTAGFVVVARLVPIVGDFLELAQPSGGTNLFVAVLAGSAFHVAAFVGVNALVADFLKGADRSGVGLRASSRLTWGRRAALVGAFVRSYVIVAILLASVVGIPWGIRQLMRYQFASQVIVYENADARSSLQRSSELTRGRWFHTALVVTAINGIVFAGVFGVSLLLLVVAAAIPLWLYSALVTLLYIFAAPLAAIAMSLLYGDAVAASEEAPVDEEAPVHELLLPERQR